jgi:hypothetical protein
VVEILTLIALIVSTIMVGFAFLFVTVMRLSRDHVRLRLEEHKTRRLEALAGMDDAPLARLLETMPDWLDPNDPVDVEAWKKARTETLQITDKGDD